MYGLEQIKEMNEQATEQAVAGSGQSKAEVAKDCLEFIAQCPVADIDELPHDTVCVMLATLVGSASNAAAFLNDEKPFAEYARDEAVLTELSARAAVQSLVEALDKQEGDSDAEAQSIAA